MATTNTLPSAAVNAAASHADDAEILRIGADVLAKESAAIRGAAERLDGVFAGAVSFADVITANSRGFTEAGDLLFDLVGFTLAAGITY